MSKLSHITIPIQLYADKRLCEIQRAILGLATAFGNRGLKISDNNLAAIFNVTRQWINELISKLKSEDYIRIEKPCSKYRVIYCQEKSTVQSKLLSSIVDSESVLLSTPTCSTVNSESTHKERSKYKTLREYWNSKENLPKIRAFTDQRKKKLDARMKEKLFVDNWHEIIDKISESSFCTGNNKRGWKAGIDWVLKNSTNYVKAYEGKYDDPKKWPVSTKKKPIPLTSEAEQNLLDQMTRDATPEDVARLEVEGVL
ncbi:hypothetical protein ACFL1G_10585 [Planctomycetota bacterium]